VYIVNPKTIQLVQPVYAPLTGTPCSHFFSLFVFTSAYSGRCLYNYGPCPTDDPQIGDSVQETGYTRLNCKDHPYLYRTCIEVGPMPSSTCWVAKKN